jgi:hypothetical protein
MRSKHEAHGGEDNHLATAMDPYSKVDYSLIAPEASMAMKKTSGGDSPLRQGAGKSFWTLPIFGSTTAADRDVLCKTDRVLRFFPSGGIYRRRGGAWRGTRRPHTTPARTGPWPRRACVRGPGGPPPAPHLISGSFRKKRPQELVSSNSENISCVSL